MDRQEIYKVAFILFHGYIPPEYHILCRFYHIVCKITTLRNGDMDKIVKRTDEKQPLPVVGVYLIFANKRNVIRS